MKRLITAVMLCFGLVTASWAADSFAFSSCAPKPHGNPHVSKPCPKPAPAPKPVVKGCGGGAKVLCPKKSGGFFSFGATANRDVFVPYAELGRYYGPFSAGIVAWDTKDDGIDVGLNVAFTKSF